MSKSAAVQELGDYFYDFFIESKTFMFYIKGYLCYHLSRVELQPALLLARTDSCGNIHLCDINGALLCH